MTAFILEFTVLHLKIPSHTSFLEHVKIVQNSGKSFRMKTLKNPYGYNSLKNRLVSGGPNHGELNGLRLITSNTVIGEETLYSQRPSLWKCVTLVKNFDLAWRSWTGTWTVSVEMDTGISGSVSGHLRIKMFNFRELVQFLINYNYLKESRLKGK